MVWNGEKYQLIMSLNIFTRPTDDIWKRQACSQVNIWRFQDLKSRAGFLIHFSLWGVDLTPELIWLRPFLPTHDTKKLNAEVSQL